jgi:hypothetical protein
VVTQVLFALVLVALGGLGIWAIRRWDARAR